MLSGLVETQKAAVTVGVFIATFFVALTIGRFLKRRAGVRFGLLFQLFCLAVAFYAAIAVAGVHADWRNHVGSILIVLATAVVVALVDRYVWDFYFEGKKQTPIPHFPRQIMAQIIYLIALLGVLWHGYHAGRLST